MEGKFGRGAHWGGGKFAEFSLPGVVPSVIVRKAVAHLFTRPYVFIGPARLMEFYGILQSCRQVQSLPCTPSSLYIKSISLNFPAFVIYTEPGARCEICRHSEKYSCDRFYCLLIERKYEPTSTFFFLSLSLSGYKNISHSLSTQHHSRVSFH